MLLPAAAWAQKPVFTTAKTDAVTVYFTNAEVSQSANAALPTGTSEVVVKNVSNSLNESTVQVSAPPSVTVLSVQFTKDYIAEYDQNNQSCALQSVRDSIKIVQNQLAQVQNEEAAANGAVKMLDNNSSFGNSSAVNADGLIKLVEYYKTQYRELKDNLLVLNAQEAQLQTRLDNLNAQLTVNEDKEANVSQGKLILQVMNSSAGNVPFQISYLSDGAGWTPAYDLRADDISSPIHVLYKAQAAQYTGVDWQKVKLTLSSGTANENTQAPTLDRWFLSYFQAPTAVNDEVQKGVASTEDADLVTASGIQRMAAGVEVHSIGAPGAAANLRIRGTSSWSANSEPLYVVNGNIVSAEDAKNISPDLIANMSVLKDASATSMYGSRGANGVILITTKQGVSNYTQIQSNELNVSFDINTPYDILSNGKQNSVVLKDFKIPATYQYYAIPRLDPDAYLVAEITDYAQYNLLKGDANLIFENMYVGKTTLDPGNVADTLKLSMGKDKRISIKREKVADKSGSKFLSSYKEQTFTYDITVRNNKKDNINLILQDQYPLSTDKDITVELLDNGNAAVDKDSGFLTWQLKLAPNESRKLRFSYKVRSAKDKTVDGL